MIYVAAFLILIVVIVLVWLIRLAVAQNQRRKLRKNPNVLPSQIQDLNHRPTFSETAEDVASRVGRHNRQRGSDPYSYHRRSDVGGVTRMVDPSASVTSLPAYGAASLPVHPVATYDPTRPYSLEAPPKYSAATTQPNQTV
ncbi:uncharacterized protein L201_007679 [Kwoniella dendrophila CBS 6074]|uniref:Uncharacterized protein n=1 Tax=Kwoniella dendrophila CBS 6074 TaxID=1295534 RepID=A0AAX4K7D6_9TREE